jgi:hypothetical protein
MMPFMKSDRTMSEGSTWIASASASRDMPSSPTWHVFFLMCRFERGRVSVVGCGGLSVGVCVCVCWLRARRHTLEHVKNDGRKTATVVVPLLVTSHLKDFLLVSPVGGRLLLALRLTLRG